MSQFTVFQQRMLNIYGMAILLFGLTILLVSVHFPYTDSLTILTKLMFLFSFWGSETLKIRFFNMAPKNA